MQCGTFGYRPRACLDDGTARDAGANRRVSDMNEISISRLAADCIRAVEEVARTGEPVTIVRDGKAIARLVPVQLTDAERNALQAASGTLDLDDDVIDAEEIAAMEETNLEWNALDRAIDQDLRAADPHLSPAKKAAAKAAGAAKTKVAARKARSATKQIGRGHV